ncbi:TVP38/TMEM64 family protein [Fervidibacillus halotolerans]|uniref:TVP38/TMEM64 family membrane protein n=1 Tax=Fervidibacillus halotolerans TaxID=2980027 RepID=A0A9E8RXE1_9BACI|nr:VTT domain-containing protein [Fervidibacillus halotolerans]WAA11641.1 VTT domain-containing protein [Fervidibacillus halotolerans]
MKRRVERLEGKTTYIISFLESSGIFAPVAFILFSTLRQFFFIPVVVVCIAGGVLFGTGFGSLFSLIGLTLSSFVSYLVLILFPSVTKKLYRIKNKWFGPYTTFTTGQITLLKLIPFIHFQLLSFCLFENRKSFSDYALRSLLSNIPVVIFYTTFGQFLKPFSPFIIILIFLALTILLNILREKMMVIKWDDFFKSTI